MDLQNTLYVLNVVLGLGTIYAWYQFYKVVANKCDTCSVGLHENPFKSKCFTGAVFFTLSFALAIYALILV
ncbi:hypothetical protein HON36_04325 [Candidatus Parcubacteria bacterium]|jgi:hypothetical protein|nr:hypothetical protein [Candidatus Parcubacteria bacterium]MBT7228492.1 hypothetical protein [Candidatus Parcubacteria bacterium]